MSREQKTWGSVVLLIAAALLTVVFLLSGRARSAPAAGQALALAQSCPASLVAGGHDYHGLTLTQCNFNGLDLTKANFNGATLTAVIFIRTILTGADFSGATIADSGNAAFPTDFSFATLTNAKFVKTVFSGATYLTYATLTCADFSQTNINNGNAIFGDDPLNIDTTQNCRTKFQGTTMNCEFVSQWDKLDLTSAVIGACVSQLQTVTGQPGHDFSGGAYANVVFDGIDLTGSNWKGATLKGASFQNAILDNAKGLSGSDLTQVSFTHASVKQVDLSTATLSGAVLDNANMEGVNLSGAILSPCTPPATCVAATLRGAHLKNVNLSGSHLVSAIFANANFYSSVAAGNGSCDTTKNNCASAKNATLTNTTFNNAYLFGVDFSGAQMHGVIFDGAVLVGVNFDGANVVPEPNQVNGSFVNAFLQGANLAGATLDGVTMSGAFVDFNPNGNTIVIQLNTNHTKFAGWKTPGQPVCTRVTYGAWASVPTNNISITCPDGLKHIDSGCGLAASDGSNARWNNNSNIGTNDPKASYRDDATYTAKAADICVKNLAW